MNIVFYCLLFLSIYHLVYESIFLPTARLGLRYRLFALRDKLRWLKSEHKVAVEENLFLYLQGSLNISINYLHRFDLITMSKAIRAVKDDNCLRAKIEDRQAMIESCPIDEIRNLQKEALRLSGIAFAANIGAWFIYLIPIVITVNSFNNIKNFLKSIFFCPEQEVGKVIPAT